MYKLVEYNDRLDLTSFYENASNRGFDNNSNKKILIDSFSKEHDSCIWILYYNDVPAGSVAAHSLDIFDKISYRICARTCVFTDLLPIRTLRSLGNTILKHQNITAQFYIPKCIEYCPVDSDLYITTNNSEIASQRQVHQIYCPALEKSGVLTKTHELMYRGHIQTFWKLDREIFLSQLNSYPRW
jgi:hypothetical protein